MNDKDTAKIIGGLFGDSKRAGKADDTDTKKIRSLSGILSMIAGRGKKPIAFLGGSTSAGFLIQWIGEQIAQSPEYRWIYFGIGVAVVLLYGAMDYGGVVLRFIQALAERLERLTTSVEAVGEELKSGFADGRERFERIELWQREHLKKHHRPGSSPKLSSNGRPKTDGAVEPPTIDPL